MKKEHKIILIEDDASLGYLLTEYLKMKNFDMTWAKTGAEGLRILETSEFDLAILDVMMPDIDGFTMAAKIQAVYPELPFLFLTARSLKIDVLRGFSVGAVDYLKKPIDEEELVVRITSLLNRLGKPNKVEQPNSILEIGKYTLNSLNQELILDGKVQNLTSRENELLQYLAANRNQLCSHRDILITIWGKNDYFNRMSLNVFVSHLRRYLNEDKAIKIENVHGGGFILKIEGTQA
jgi:DNA-binding response OmpR family regulator